MTTSDKLVRLDGLKAVYDNIIEKVDDIGSVVDTLIERELKYTLAQDGLDGRFTVNSNSVIGTTQINLDSPGSGASWKYIIIPCAGVKRITVKSPSSTNYRSWFFVDNDGILLEYNTYSSTAIKEENVAIVSGATKFVVQSSSAEAKVTLIAGEGILNNLQKDVNQASCGYITKTRAVGNSTITITTDSMGDAIKSIVLHGATENNQPISGYNKLYVLNGTEAWRTYSSFENSFRGPTVLSADLAENYSAGLSDGFLVQTSGTGTKNSMRIGPELFLINTDFATVDDLKAYLSEHPVRIWYRSDNYTSSESQYYACSIKMNTAYPAIGTDEKINPLYEGDTIDFVSGTVIRANSNKETVKISAPLTGINGIVRVTSQNSIDITYARSLADKFASVTGNETPQPMLSIIDDDGHIGFYNLVLPLIIEKKVPIATAIVTNRANGDTSAQNWMTWAQILECYHNGAEVLSHNFTHMHVEDIVDLSDYEIQWAYQKAKNQLREHGITADLLVYNGATGDYAQVREGAKRVFRGAFLPGGSVSAYTDGGDRFGINRYPVDGHLSDLPYLYGLIDKVKAEGGWMVWMVHTSGDGNLNAETIGNLGLAIDYAREQGVAIVTAETGFDYYVDRFWPR